MQQLNRSHSFKPDSVRREDIPALHHENDRSAERKLLEVRGGGELIDRSPILPESRRCQNSLWGPFFLLVVLGVLTFTFLYANVLADTLPSEEDLPSESVLRQVAIAVAGGGLGSVVAVVVAIVFLQVAHQHPASVVYVSLYFSPVLCIGSGLLILTVNIIPGAILILSGMLSLAIVCCCYGDLIPFMIELTRMVAGVIVKNPAMLAIAFALSVFSLVWTVICGIGMGGAIVHFGSDVATDDDPSNDGPLYAALVTSIFVFLWGSQVIYNVCHVTYCGVFARWYYQRPMSEGPVLKSLGVALTTSFGSICFGSFTVALIRTMEVVVKSARRQAAEEGNVVTCILLCLLECFIACIGDMLEYFNEWAYVQCALRGVDFISGVRITFAMFTCANMQYILQDMLLNSVINLGAVLCAVVGTLAAFAFGWFMGSETDKAGGSAVLGFVASLVAGGICFSVIGSGVKTILVCWTDNPNQLKLENEAIEMQFTNKVNDGYDKHMGLAQSEITPVGQR